MYGACDMAAAQTAGWEHKLQGGSTNCRVGAQTAGWEHKLQGGSTNCRVGAQTAGWEHKLQGGSTNCRVGAQTAGWEHKLQGGSTNRCYHPAQDRGPEKESERRALFTWHPLCSNF